jgi:hypothetical protein
MADSNQEGEMAEQNDSNHTELRAMLTPDAAALRRARRRRNAARRAHEKSVDAAFQPLLEQWCDDQIPDDPSMQEDWYARYGGLDEEELAEVQAEEQEQFWRDVESERDDREFDPERDLPPGVYERLRAEAARADAVEPAAQKRFSAELELNTLLAMERLRELLGL